MADISTCGRLTSLRLSNKPWENQPSSGWRGKCYKYKFLMRPNVLPSTLTPLRKEVKLLRKLARKLLASGYLHDIDTD